MKSKIYYLTIAIGALTIFLTPHMAFGWYGNWGGQSQDQDLGYYGAPVGCGGYCAGQQDAIYDHQQGNPYNPVGQCFECHSQDYWDNFKQGYDNQWNTYQSQDQTSSQGASINIYGNNYGTASIGQSTNQGQTQNPLQQLAHTVCGLINCNPQVQPQPYQQGYGQDQPNY